MNLLLRVTALSLLVFLAACSFTGGTEETTTPPHPLVENTAPPPPPPVRETKNVTYTGVIRPAGISIYQEGTHRLVLDDDRFILLESETVDLNGYVGEETEVFGATRPTVEEGGTIMRVEKISMISGEEEEEVKEEDTEEEPVEKNEDSEKPEEDVPADTEEETNEEPEEEVIPEKEIESDEEEVTEEETGEEEEVVQEPVPEDMQERIAAMAADDYSAERWTQQYCTGHIGFCIPIHKNWWYKSFGNTTSHLWHVEMSNGELEHMGEGPIVLKLVSGSIGSKKATDKQVRVEGGKIVGYRAWDDSRHFEISADVSLDEPVRYMTDNLSKYGE